MKRRTKQIFKFCGAMLLSASMIAGDVVGAISGIFGSKDVSISTTVEAEAATPDITILTNEERNAIFEGTRTDFRDESIYFVMVTRYYNGDESNDVQCWDGTQYNLNDPAWRGDFKGLIEKLDYIKALGFTAIWITPVVENCSGYDYHGYHAMDFTTVDERYESDDCTYQDLIDAVHDKGMKIIQDVVFNHTGNFGEANLVPMFEKEGDLSSVDCLQLAEGTSLPANYFELNADQQYQARLALMKNTDGVNHDVNNLYHHYGNFNWDDYTCQIAQIAGDCVDLNTENPLVYNYLIDAYTKYIDMGVDGFRVDTVRHISRLTFNKAFNDAFHEAAAKNGNDDFFMFGEVCTRDNGNYWYRNNPGMSTPFYTWKESKDYEWSDTDWEVNYNSAIQCTIDNEDNIDEQPTSDNAFLDGNTYHEPDYSQFSGLSVIDFPMHWSFKSASNAFSVATRGDHTYNDATWNVTYVDSHDYAPDGAPESERFNQDQSTWAENLSLMFTFRGIPCIYYGSETEFQKGAPIDKGPNIALAESGRAYYGDNLEGEVTATGFASYGDVSGTVKDTLSNPLSQHIQRLNRIRQAVPALRKGQYSTEGVSGSLAFKRRYTDDTTDSFVCVSISGDATFSGIPNGKYVDAVTGDVQVITNNTLSVSVSGKGNLKCYVLDTAKTPAPGRVITNGEYLTDGGEAELIEYDTVNRIEVTGVTLDKAAVSVLEAETVKVTATITPENATTKTVKWTSSDTSVATVSGGKITGIAPGTATITATSNNGKTATVKVTVSTNPNIIKPSGITLDKITVSLVEGNSETVTATVLPSDATNKKVTWKSADTDIATVDGSGKITAVKVGSTTITASTFNGCSQSVTVIVKAKTIENIGPGVYFEKPSGWGDNINVYLWDEDKTQYAGGWPGKQMTEVGDGVYGYSFETDESIQGMMVIFNDGSNQTADLEYVQNGLYTSAGFKRLMEFDEAKEGTVVVNYVLTSGTILDTEVLTGTVGEPYTTTQKSFENLGYIFKSATDNTSGVYTEEDIVVTYTYQVQYVTNELKVSLTANGIASAQTVNVGDTVALMASASGGSGSNYTYSFLINNPDTNEWYRYGSGTFKSSNTHSWKVAGKGSRNFYVEVKDSTGKVVRSSAVKVNIQEEAATPLSVKATANNAMPEVGNTITITADATGGSGSYTYSFLVNNVDTNEWYRYNKTFKTDNTQTWKAAGTGTRRFYAEVKDSTGKVVRSSAVTVTIQNSEQETLKITAKASNSSPSVGASVTITGQASGGSGSYTYSFLVNNVDTNEWYRYNKVFKTDNTLVWKASGTGTRKFYVEVKDGTGKVVRSSATTVVTK